jgi:cobalt/nickel transport system permease protein
LHVQDGVVPLATWGLGWGAATVLTAACLPRLKDASPPRVAMMTSTFFVASLLSFPVAGTSVHLSLIGLCGVVLGRAAFPSILVGVALQFALFGHGGASTVGLNATSMGSGALIAAALYHSGTPSVARAVVAAVLGTVTAISLFGAAMLSAGHALRAVAYASILVHLPVIAIEAVVTAAAVRFLLRVQPDLVGLTPGVPGSTPDVPK